MPKIQCSLCLETKTREAKLNEKGGRYYIEPSTNLQWKGRTCPECVNFKDVEPTVELSTRKCRDCKKFLTSDRYFKCIECQPTLHSIQDDFIYEADELDEYTVETIGDLFQEGDRVDETDQSNEIEE